VSKDGITVIIAMDGSEFADYALKCKFLFWFTFLFVVQRDFNMLYGQSL
jgi:hypothetical protein